MDFDDHKVSKYPDDFEEMKEKMTAPTEDASTDDTTEEDDSDISGESDQDKSEGDEDVKDTEQVDLKYISRLKFSFEKIHTHDTPAIDGSINSLDEFLVRIDQLDEKDSESEYAFRGTSKFSLISEPSLFRNKGVQKEWKYYHHIIRLVPEEFSDKSAFDVLCKMQHYSIPTRLLDFTSNPLVALFFACKDNNSDDGDVENGKVEVIKGKFYQSDLHEIQIICLIGDFLSRYRSEYYHHANTSLSFFHDYLLKKHIDCGNTPINDYLNAIFEVPYIGIRPNHTNARLRAQQGLFLLFGIGAKSMYPNQFPYDRLRNPPNIDSENKYTIKIPHFAKKDILKQLERIGIDNSRLFPDLEHIAEFVKDDLVRLEV